MRVKPYKFLPKGHPSDVVWLCLINAKCRNMRDPSDRSRQYKFRVPVFLAKGHPSYGVPVPKHLAEDFLSMTVRVPMEADESGTVQSAIQRSVPLFAQVEPPLDWPRKLKAAGLAGGASALYPDGIPDEISPDPAHVARLASDAVDSALLERGRKIAATLGQEAVNKLIDEGVLPESLRKELPGQDHASQVELIMSQGATDAAQSIRALTDLDLLAALLKAEDERPRTRSTVKRAITETRDELEALADVVVSPAVQTLEP